MHIGLLWAGFKFDWVGYSEIDDYANKVYAKHFPDAVPLGDITKINPKKLYKPIDIITEGFPCQDISIAGKQKGITGERSSLFNEIIRIAGVVRPKALFLENVPNLLSGENGEWMRHVLGEIAKIGYDAEWQVISAAEVGAWHKRERVWIIAYPQQSRTGMETHRSSGQTGEISQSSQSKVLRQKDGAISSEGINSDSQDVSNSSIQRLPEREKDKFKNSILSTEYSGMQTDVSNSTIKGLEGKNSESEFSERKQGLPAKCRDESKISNPIQQHGNNRRYGAGTIQQQEPPGLLGSEYWDVEPGICRVADGIPNRVHRLKCLGGSVVPQCVKVIGEFIINSGLLNN